MSRFAFFLQSHIMKRVVFDDVLFIESNLDYIEFNMQNSKEIVKTYISISRAEKILPKEIFVRINRCYIVNMNKIISIDGWICLLEGGVKFLNIGDTYKESLISKINYIGPEYKNIKKKNNFSLNQDGGA